MISQEQYIANIETLKNEYHKWKAPVVTLIAIHSRDPFRILISTILSLRTKDEVTSKASERLFAVADSAEKMMKLSPSEIEKLIYPVGFYRRKAVQIIEVCRRIVEEFDSKVPSNLDDLLSFDGVGRKTANLVLSMGYNIPAICVDTHVHRISNRWGFVETKTPEKTEFALMEKLPKEIWSDINDLIVAFGQTICKPIKPNCKVCPIPYCVSRVVEEK